MKDRLELVIAIIALVTIACADAAWQLKSLAAEFPLQTDAVAAVARSQALPVIHLAQ